MRSVAVVTEFLGVVCPVGMTLVYVLGRVSSAGSGATTKLRVARPLAAAAPPNLGRQPGRRRRAATCGGLRFRGCDERGTADIHPRRQHQLASLLPGGAAALWAPRYPAPCEPRCPCLAGRPAGAPIPCVRLLRHVRADAHQRAPPLSLASRRCSWLVPPLHRGPHALTLLSPRAVCAARGPQEGQERRARPRSCQRLWQHQ